MARRAQRYFFAGELSPSLNGQVGGDVYQAGLRLAKNCYFTENGTVRKRWGTEQLAFAPPDSTAWKLGRFTSPQGEYLLLWYWDSGDSLVYLSIWDTSTSSYSTFVSGWGYGSVSVPYYTEASVDAIRFKQPDDDLYFCSSGGPLYRLRQFASGAFSLDRVGSSNLHGPICHFITTPFSLTYTVDGNDEVLTADASYFNGEDEDSLFLVDTGLYLAEQRNSPTQLKGDTTANYGFRTGGKPDVDLSTTNWYGPFVFSGTSGVTWGTVTSAAAAPTTTPTRGVIEFTGTADFRIGDILQSNATPSAYFMVTAFPSSTSIEVLNYGNGALSSTPGSCDIYAFSSRVESSDLFVQPTGTADVGTIHSVRGYFQDEHRESTSNPGAEFVIRGGLIRFTDTAASSDDRYEFDAVVLNNTTDRLPTAELQVAANSYDGYVSVLTHHQGRLYAAGFERHPNGFTGSRSGFYNNWELGPNDADAVRFEISSDEFSKITWMYSARDLVIGTEREEYVASGAPITPSIIGVDWQAGHGGREAVEAQGVGSQIFYADSSGQAIRRITYSEERGQSLFPRVSSRAEHMFESDLVEELHYMRSPEPILLAVRASGQIAALTWHEDEGIAAWSDWSGFKSETMVVSKQPDEDWVYFIAKSPRTTPGAQDLAQLLVMKPSSTIHMDYWRSVAVTADGQVNATDLDGLEVYYKTGEVFAGRYQVAGGSFTTQYFVSSETQRVGVPIDFRVRPQSQEPGSTRGDSDGLKHRVSNVHVLLRGSRDVQVSGQQYRPATMPSAPGADEGVYPTSLPAEVVNWAKVSAVGKGQSPGIVEWPVITSASPYPFELVSVAADFETGDS